MKDLSVIFVNYKTKEMTADAIQSVFDKTEGVNYDIIVVDNNSKDGSVKFIKEKFDNKITLIESKENRGFGAGNNLGIKASNAKYVFLLNTDTLLINNAIKILFDFMELNPNVGACGGNMYATDGKPINSVRWKLPGNKFAITRLFAAIKLKLLKVSPGFNYSKMNKKTGSIVGADMLIRKTALDEVGMFDEDFFLYYEETELCHRLWKNGWESYSVPEAMITHFEGGSTIKKNDEEKSFRTFQYSEFLFFEKTKGNKAVRKHYKRKKRYYLILNILKFGTRKKAKMKCQIMDQEYQRWQRR